MNRVTNREKYHFDDFTESAYRDCLKLAKSRYTFINFHQLQKPGRVCLWRHDVDTSPQRGLALARIEKEEGIQSTFFFLLHSDRYNTLDYQVREVIRNIQALGHEIGLHFDPVYYGGDISNRENMEKWMTYERDILSEVSGQPIRVFSFHNPFVNRLVEIGHEHMGGMVNAFSTSIQKNSATVPIPFVTGVTAGLWMYCRMKPSKNCMCLLTRYAGHRNPSARTQGSFAR